MHVFRDGQYVTLEANIRKCIIIDKETDRIIRNAEGRSYSDRLRNIVNAYDKGERREKCY